MSLTPEQQDQLDTAIRRRVAVAALKNLQRKLESDAHEESRDQRRAGPAIGLMLVVFGLFIAYYLGQGLFQHLGAGLPATASVATEALKASVLTALTMAVLAVGLYFCIHFPGFNRRFAVLAVASTILVSLIVAGLYFSFVRVTGCRDGWHAANSNDFDRAIADLTTCLAAPRLATETRIRALETRARAYEKLGQPELARRDFEQCVKILSSQPNLTPELTTLLSSIRAKLEPQKK